MASISFSFTPWRKFHAAHDKSAIRRWLQSVADTSQQIFTGSMGYHPPSSSPGAWPNVRTAGLRRSVKTEVKAMEMTIGTSQPYSGFLRKGTRKMARRKMSDNALKEGLAASKGRL